MGNENTKLETQKNFNVSRYMGKWYEIAKYPFKWEKNCNFSQATYTWHPISERIDVQNDCLDATRIILYSRNGVARIPDKNDKSKLKIHFNDGLPADPEGDYWCFYTDYDKYSIVGEPKGEHLWILSRTPKIPVKDVKMLTDIIKSKGYDPNKLISNPSLLYK
jgi:apolipoprotein D and lipocalin family protein